MKKLILFCLLAVALKCEAANPTVVWTNLTADGSPQGERKLELYPIGAPWTNGIGGIITRDRVSRETGTNGSLTISNLFPGSYRGELKGTFAVTTNWYAIPDTNGVIFAADYATVPTNGPNGILAYTRAQTDALIRNATNGISGGSGGSATNVFVSSVLTGETNLVIGTNGLKYTFDASKLVGTNKFMLASNVLSVANSATSNKLTASVASVVTNLTAPSFLGLSVDTTVSGLPFSILTTAFSILANGSVYSDLGFHGPIFSTDFQGILRGDQASFHPGANITLTTNGSGDVTIAASASGSGDMLQTGFQIATNIFASPSAAVAIGSSNVFQANGTNNQMIVGVNRTNNTVNFGANAQIITSSGAFSFGGVTGLGSGNLFISSLDVATGGATIDGGGNLTAATSIASPIIRATTVTAQHYLRPTNVWTPNGPIGMGTNLTFVVPDNATIGVTTIQGAMVTGDYASLDLFAEGRTSTFTNPVSMHASDGLTSRVISNRFSFVAYYTGWTNSAAVHFP